MRYINQTRLDDRIIRTDWDAGFIEGRQFGRGRSGGQVWIFITLISKKVTFFILNRYVMNIVKIMIQVVVDMVNDKIHRWKWTKVVSFKCIVFKDISSKKVFFFCVYLLFILE